MFSQNSAGIIAAIAISGMKNRKFNPEFLFFSISLAVLGVAYGMIAQSESLFPSQLIHEARQGLASIKKTIGLSQPWYIISSETRIPNTIKSSKHYEADDVYLITRINHNKEMVADIIRTDGRLLHSWILDWYKIWPDAKHIPEVHMPKDVPGALIHGAEIMSNGDLLFNFDYMGLVRINREGNVVWKLPYRTHHSIHIDNDGTIWTSGVVERTKADPKLPARPTPFDEYTIIQVSPDGKILKEWSLFSLLADNGYLGAYSVSAAIPYDLVRDDILHVNDVETFPSNIAAGFFGEGDVVVSIRNPHAVFVFNTSNDKIKFYSADFFCSQHDPDFIDGNSISVYDNNYMGDHFERPAKIVKITLPERTYSNETKGTRFASSILGKHQWLGSSELLVTESMKGRAFIVSGEGELLWEYFNRLDDYTLGIITEAQRLTPSQSQWFQ